MLRKIKASVVAALCCTVVGAGLAGCRERLGGELGPVRRHRRVGRDP